MIRVASVLEDKTLHQTVYQTLIIKEMFPISVAQSLDGKPGFKDPRHATECKYGLVRLKSESMTTILKWSE